MGKDGGMIGSIWVPGIAISILLLRISLADICGVVVASFEEDRRKVESMRVKRGKFRPEQ